MIGKRMRDLREASGFTQEELAEKIGVNVLQINRYEHNKNNPTSDIAAKIATALNTSTDYLLGLTDEPTPMSWVKSGLTAKERAALAAWRRGERLEAAKVILNDE